MRPDGAEGRGRETPRRGERAILTLFCVFWQTGVELVCPCLLVVCRAFRIHLFLVIGVNKGCLVCSGDESLYVSVKPSIQQLC